MTARSDALEELRQQLLNWARKNEVLIHPGMTTLWDVAVDDLCSIADDFEEARRAPAERPTPTDFEREVQTLCADVMTMITGYDACGDDMHSQPAKAVRSMIRQHAAELYHRLTGEGAAPAPAERGEREDGWIEALDAAVKALNDAAAMCRLGTALGGRRSRADNTRRHRFSEAIEIIQALATPTTETNNAEG